MALTRADKLYTAGLNVLGPDPTRAEDRLLMAMAAMLDEATRPATAKKKSSRPTKLPFSPQELYEAVKETGTVCCEPYNQRWFGQLGKKLQSMLPGLQRSDMDALVAWLESGGLKWMKEPPSFGTLVKHIEEWIPRARAADGGQLELDLGACL